MARSPDHEPDHKEEEARNHRSLGARVEALEEIVRRLVEEHESARGTPLMPHTAPAKEA